MFFIIIINLNLNNHIIFKKYFKIICIQAIAIKIHGHGLVAQLVGVLSHIPKGCRFDFWSGHTPRL